MLSKITVSPPPHIGQPLSTRRVMLDVLIGLLPAVCAAGYFFRRYTAIVICVCVASCLISEWVCNLLRRRPCSLGDLSAAVTGVILALSLPPSAPLWVAALGGAFAIVIVKMLFGGLGANVFNPAMASRAFLTASFGVLMTTWTVPATIDSNMGGVVAANTSAITQATPLAWSKMALKSKTSAKEVDRLTEASFWGQEGGCLGETSALAILIGGAYLLFRRTISWHIPAAVILSAAAVATVGWLAKPQAYVSPWLHLCSGGLLLCAFFIATDPVTAPLTKKGQWVFGAGIGTLIMLIRLLGEYPEGVMYAVLIMNGLSPLIDRWCRLTPSGGRPRV